MGNVSKALSAAPLGYDSHLVEVECDMTRGLPGLQIVGLGNKAIDEAKERVKSALGNSMLEYPPKRITVNLAPAELPKDGTHYDLPIALAILVASGQLRQEDVKDIIFAGELALDGRLRPISGAINIAEVVKKTKSKTIILPTENASQASLIEGITIIGASSLKELFLHLKGEMVMEPYTLEAATDQGPAPSGPVLDDVKGQEQAKRALIIAAAGHHNILFTGPPGSGKTMLAKTLNSLLPRLSSAEKLEVTKIHSLAGTLISDVMTERPFRSPHHTSSQISMVGGGNRAKPGEISLAHLGVLFLDEIPEYNRSTLEALRQPLEDRQITVARANGRATYPANFMLVATMNPCPCGYYGDSSRECSCTSNQIINYQKHLSGPLMDRIDLVVQVSRVPSREFTSNGSLSNTHHIEASNLIDNSSTIQHLRYKSNNKYNSSLTNSEIKKHLKLTDDVKNLLDTASDKLGLSARGYFKIIKVARTIADLDSSEDITVKHISEALQYRQPV